MIQWCRLYALMTHSLLFLFLFSFAFGGKISTIQFIMASIKLMLAHVSSTIHMSFSTFIECMRTLHRPFYFHSTYYFEF